MVDPIIDRIAVLKDVEEAIKKANSDLVSGKSVVDVVKTLIHDLNVLQGIDPEEMDDLREIMKRIALDDEQGHQDD